MIQRFEQFTGAIVQIYRCIQKIKSAEMTELGLKGQHAQCLVAMGERPQGVTAAELCALCEEDKAAVSRTVADLEDRGLVACAQPGRKRYRARLTLTDRGLEIARQVNKRVEQAVLRGGDGLTAERREEFYAALNLVADNLKRFCGEKTGEIQV